MGGMWWWHGLPARVRAEFHGQDARATSGTAPVSPHETLGSLKTANPGSFSAFWSSAGAADRSGELTFGPVDSIGAVAAIVPVGWTASVGAVWRLRSVEEAEPIVIELPARRVASAAT